MTGARGHPRRANRGVPGACSTTPSTPRLPPTTPRGSGSPTAPAYRDWVLDLVRREAACCPFLSYEVDIEDDHIVWTVSGGVGASDMALLDEFFTNADPTGSSTLIAQELDRGGIPVIVPQAGGN